jgi:hypothetical protein
MFYPFRGEIAPTLHPEHPDGTGPDVLEANLIDVDGDFELSLPDFWRVATDGRSSLIRPYREDRLRSVRELQREAGTWLSPETVIRETAELVTHARCLARRFEAARQVSFRCTWVGLENRELADFDPSVHWSRRIAKAKQRTVEGEWAAATLAAAWPTIVAELGCPSYGCLDLQIAAPLLFRAWHQSSSNSDAAIRFFDAAGGSRVTEVFLRGQQRLSSSGRLPVRLPDSASVNCPTSFPSPPLG